ncbi:15217_t:CDS:2, partial [Racocetra persica]
KTQSLRYKLTSDEKRSLESELFEDLKYLMNIDNINVVDEVLVTFFEKWKNSNSTTNMDTTNMLESWHKHLKYDNFEGKVNRRIDVLIYELYIVMDGDTWQQRCFADVRAGRMMPAEREVHRRQIKAQELPQQLVPTSEELIHNIHEMTQNLNDLDINSLQVVRNQLFRVLEDVCRLDKSFQEGDWVNDQNIKFLPN